MKIEGDQAILKHSLWLQIIRNVSFSTLTLNEFDIDLLNLTYHVYLVNWEENDQIRLLINTIKWIVDSIWNKKRTFYGHSVCSVSRQNTKCDSIFSGPYGGFKEIFLCTWCEIICAQWMNWQVTMAVSMYDIDEQIFSNNFSKFP